MGSGEQPPWPVVLSRTSEFRRFPTGRFSIEVVESAVSAAGHVIVHMREFPSSEQAPALLGLDKGGGV